MNPRSPHWLQSRLLIRSLFPLVLLLLIFTGSAFGQCLIPNVQVAPSPGADIFANNFGVASALAGDVAVIGADRAEVSFPNNPGPGKAYVYRFDGAAWNLEATLAAADGIDGVLFGRSISLSDSGNDVVVGAPLQDGTGAVYVFHFNGTTWDAGTRLQTNASDLSGGDELGFSVSISEDGDTIISGARKDSEFLGSDDVGSAYIFERNLGGPNNWGQKAKIVASNGADSDQFGEAVSISGAIIAIGAPFHISGSVYVFRRDTSGNWNETQEIAGVNNQLGRSISVDGDVLLVGAPNDVGGGNVLSPDGAVFVYRDTAGTFIQEAKIITADTDGGTSALFGISVSVQGDFAAVGQVDANADGAAYFYRHNAGVWGEETKVVPPLNQASIALGISVAVDGGRAIAGAKNFNNPSAPNGAGFFINGVADCNGNGVMDACDISQLTYADCDNNGVPDPCERSSCPGDIAPCPGGNNDVNIDDLVAVLNGFGDCPGSLVTCQADITPVGPPMGNGVVNIDDLVEVLNHFGPCTGITGPGIGGITLQAMDFSNGWMDASGNIDAASASLVGAAWVANQNGFAPVDVYRAWADVSDGGPNSILTFVGGGINSGPGGVSEPLVLSAGKGATFFVPHGDYSQGVFVPLLAVDGGVGNEWYQSQAFGSFIALGSASNSILVSKQGDVAALDGILLGSVNEANTGWSVTPVAGQGVVSDGAGGWRVLIGQFAVPKGKTFTVAVRLAGDGIDVYATANSVVTTLP